MNNNSPNILDIKNIEVMYDNVILALHDVSLKVPKGKVVALLGANGAGKSTTLKAVSTMLASERGKVTKGSIDYDGNSFSNGWAWNGSSIRGQKMFWPSYRRRKYYFRRILKKIIQVRN